MRLLIACIAAIGLAAGAAAQQAGSTYPEGANLPQRSAGEAGPKTAGQMGGSVSYTSSHHVQKKKLSHKGAKPRRARARSDRSPG